MDYSLELGNLQLLPGFPGFQVAIPLSAEISRLLNQTENEAAYIGAYPEKNWIYILEKNRFKMNFKSIGYRVQFHFDDF